MSDYSRHYAGADRLRQDAEADVWVRTIAFYRVLGLREADVHRGCSQCFGERRESAHRTETDD